jgi:predicted AAA+ superfamily ATPase
LADAAIETALARSRVTAMIGPRQCGKTTLARQFVAPDSPNYFDLEDPISLEKSDASHILPAYRN